MSEKNNPSNVKNILNYIETFIHNPSQIRRALFNHLDSLMNNQVMNLDSSSPMGYVLESMSVMLAAFCDHSYSLNRQQYPTAAKTHDDLYYHMCDKDYIGRFAQPSCENFFFIFNKEEIENNMVYDETLDIYKIVIPRNTSLTVGDLSFTMEYPIEIHKLQHGGLQVIYDTSEISPIQKLESNIVEWTIRKYHSVPNDFELLMLKIPLYQTKITSITKNVSLAMPVDIDIPVSDYYYFTRVYYQDSFSNWVEMEVTHNPYIYNIDKPTAILKVTENNLNVTIPQIYVTKNLVDTCVKVDTYQTKGELNVNLGGYAPNEITVNFTANDKKRDLNKFTAPMTTPLPSLKVSSSGTTTSGRNPLSFDELKRRVINNSIGPKTIPISPNQMEDALEDEGFKVVKNVDVVTNRVFFASRSLGKPKNEKLITAAASSIESLLTTLDTIVTHGQIADNGPSITILPGTIYESKNGVINIVNSDVINSILKLPPDQKVQELNQHHYYYSPFHYVMDMNDDGLDLRAYYLDDPKILAKSFIGVNDSTLLQVTCDGYSITKNDYGYTLFITTKSSSSFKELKDDDIHVQLSFIPHGEKDYAYLNGEFYGLASDDKERIYKFDIRTNHDVDKFNKLIITNFKMYDAANRNLGIDLTADVNIIFSTTAELGKQWKLSKFDPLSGDFLLPKNNKFIICEQLCINFGSVLDSLWKQARSIVSTAEYLKYQEDVFEVYEEDVLNRDANGSAVKIDGDKVVINYLHRKGDPVLDNDGKPKIKYKKGTVVLNSNQKPIIVNPRGIARQIDLLMVEAVYWFADDPIALNYRNEMIGTFLNWMIDGLDNLNKKALEQTKIYFYPRATLGQIDIMYNNGIKVKINAAQSLFVDLVVNKNVYLNADLRKKIELSTIKVIDSLLSKGTISSSDIITELQQIYGNDVIGIKLRGLGENNEIIAMSVLDASKRCSIKKRLVTQSDNTIMVEEDVTVNFIKHDINEITK